MYPVNPNHLGSMNPVFGSEAPLGLCNALPLPLGVASAGVSPEAAHCDHVHAHGDQAGGTLHALATALLAGFMSAADKAKLDLINAEASPALLLFGANSVSATTTTRYLFPGYSNALAPPAPAVQFRIPFACRVRNLRVIHNNTAGNGNDIVYTFRKAGAATALTVSLASTALSAANLVDVVSLVAGDFVDLEVTKAASVGTSPMDIFASLEIFRA